MQRSVAAATARTHRAARAGLGLLALVAKHGVVENRLSLGGGARKGAHQVGVAGEHRACGAQWQAGEAAPRRRGRRVSLLPFSNPCGVCFFSAVALAPVPPPPPLLPASDQPPGIPPELQVMPSCPRAAASAPQRPSGVCGPESTRLRCMTAPQEGGGHHRHTGQPTARSRWIGGTGARQRLQTPSRAPRSRHQQGLPARRAAAGACAAVPELARRPCRRQRPRRLAALLLMSSAAAAAGRRG